MTEEVKALIMQGEMQTQIVLNNYLNTYIPSNLSTLGKNNALKNQSQKLNNQLDELILQKKLDTEYNQALDDLRKALDETIDFGGLDNKLNFFKLYDKAANTIKR